MDNGELLGSNKIHYGAFKIYYFALTMFRSNDNYYAIEIIREFRDSREIKERNFLKFWIGNKILVRENGKERRKNISIWLGKRMFRLCFE